ncbi:hypothetical protein ACFQS7_26105 [Dankookia sp. GCM10030260]|uniref:hypothetical protein n=1 Tax=Dankookia sp. GCM10030260 TaxID=3273390 RepID=UPI0036174327
MSSIPHGAEPASGPPLGTTSSFALPARQRRIGAGDEDPPARLLTMVAIGFLLASPVITLLLAVP